MTVKRINSTLKKNIFHSFIYYLIKFKYLISINLKYYKRSFYFILRKKDNNNNLSIR